MRLSTNGLILLFASLLWYSGFPREAQAETISEVRVDRNQLDFKRGDTATINWRLGEAVTVSAFICDLKGTIVKNLVRREEQGDGEHTSQWDGRDDQGKQCPNGLYVPIIQTDSPLKGTAFYNPTALAWGEDIQATNLQFDGSQEVSFAVDRLAYGRLRVGLKEGGPILKTLASWQLWQPGMHTVSWNGKDKNEVHYVADNQKFAISFNAFVPPENSIIIVGSADDSLGDGRDQFPVHPPGTGKHNQFSIDPGSQRGDPAIAVSYRKGKKKTKSDPGSLSGIVQIHIAFTEPDKNSANITTKTEIYLYIDDQFVGESPINGLPASVDFDTKKFANGEHLVTVNLYTGDDRVGIHVQKIVINN
jgi:hypothetical protein